MNRIHTLPPAVVAKIAAGEVIERPAYAVKELVENAIDAGATQITVETEKGGMAAIVVTDNGEGMTQSDLLLSWQPHTTSKTPADSDLARIETLGFRGEALSSIAAVGNLVIQSRPRDEPGGSRLEIQTGRFVGCSPVGMAPGTIVRVEDLFAAVPARQKFLSGIQTEWQHIVRVMESFALAYPAVRFVLRHNGRPVLDVSKQTREERLSAVLGGDVFRSSFPFVVDGPHFSVSGYLGKPQASFQTNVPSYLIVNGRVVRNRKLAAAIGSAYRGLLMVDASPFYLLYITVPPEMADVNIHPRKEDITFLNESDLCDRIAEGIRQIAAGQDLMFRWTTPKADTASAAARTLRSDVVTALSAINRETPMVQIHNLYIVAQTATGILLIDQHAAHERVLYERYCERYERLRADGSTFTFPEPLLLTLPLSQRPVFDDNMPMLAALGFTIVPAGAGTYAIRTVPEYFRDRDIVQLFQEILGDLEETGTVSGIDRHTNRMLSFLACRSAVKSGDPLTPEQIRELVRQLSLTHTAYTCPHGRPTHIEMALGDLERMFGR
jgi:DNA mismatch repair protein MutL